LLRIRGGTQDDSHIICTPDQLIDEILKVFELTFEIHATFGFGDPIINLSTLPGRRSWTTRWPRAPPRRW
jgi:threonyl-tRNA synthetase